MVVSPDPLIQIAQPPEVTVRCRCSRRRTATERRNRSRKGKSESQLEPRFDPPLRHRRHPRPLRRAAARPRHGRPRSPSIWPRPCASAPRNGAPPRVVLGGDTRESTPEICRWLAAGLTAGGVEVRYAGVIPTPGVAYLVRETRRRRRRRRLGQPQPLPGQRHQAARPAGARSGATRTSRRSSAGCGAGAEVASSRTVPRSSRRSIRRCASAICATSPRPLPGRALRSPACGWCSTPATAPPRATPASCSTRLGAGVTLLHAEPDGRNVNERLRLDRARRDGGAGGGRGGRPRRRLRRRRRPLHPRRRDRARCATATPSSISGRPASTASGHLDPPRIVATSMSNLGLERALAARGDRHRPLRRRRPLRGGGDAQGGDPARRRAVRPHRRRATSPAPATAC